MAAYTAAKIAARSMYTTKSWWPTWSSIYLHHFKFFSISFVLDWWNLHSFISVANIIVLSNCFLLTHILIKWGMWYEVICLHFEIEKPSHYFLQVMLLDKIHEIHKILYINLFNFFLKLKNLLGILVCVYLYTCTSI